ncbi:hypothetical protein [Spartinivicinus ruber]|uniref:hypothetical protein n=1 Tax=Spartinivicinus ruber TaxID=2683272 RepID=UPI0013D4C52B|nr:hypothetical protein [Spartinivicinus ruber]
MTMSVNGVPAAGFTPNSVVAEPVRPAEGLLAGRTIKLEKANEVAKKMFLQLVGQPLQQVKQGLVKAFSRLKQVPEIVTQFFQQTQSHSQSNISLSTQGSGQTSQAAAKTYSVATDFRGMLQTGIDGLNRGWQGLLGQADDLKESGIDKQKQAALAGGADTKSSGNGPLRALITGLTALKEMDKIAALTQTTLSPELKEVSQKAQQLIAAEVFDTKFSSWGTTDGQGPYAKGLVDPVTEREPTPQQVADRVIELAEEAKVLSVKLDGALNKQDKESEELNHQLQSTQVSEAAETITQLTAQQRVNMLEEQYVEGTAFNGRSATDDKTKALLDVTSYLSSQVRQKDKLTLTPELQNQLQKKFQQSQLNYYDVKDLVKTTADLRWLRGLALDRLH